MNFDDYVNHTRKKYRLALAVTIIKNKPDYITTQEYIEILRKNIENETNTTLDEISINSNDFMYDEDAGKEIDTNLEDEATTNGQNNKENILSNILCKEHFGEDDQLVNNTTNKAETNEISQEINRDFDIYHENSHKLTKHEDEATSTSAFQTIAFNPTFETHNNMDSPNILDNFDLKHVNVNKTLILKDTALHNETNNVMETHENMNSPNILENFDIEHAIQAHTVSKTIETCGKEFTVVDTNRIVTKNVASVVEYDVSASKLQMKSHENDITQSKAINVSSFLTKTDKQTSRPTIIIEDTQLIDSDDDSNVTNGDIAYHSLDNLTDNDKNNFNTQTTFCDETSQLETINLINININACGNKKNSYGNNGELKKTRDPKVTFCDLTEHITPNSIPDLHPRSKGKDELNISNNLTLVTKKHCKSKQHNELKRKLEQPNETKIDKDNNMLLQTNRIDDSQATQLYTVYEISQPLSHISQSQVINTYNIDPKHISKAKQQKILTKEIHEEDINIQLSSEIAYQDATQDFDYNYLDINKNRTKEHLSKDSYPINDYKDSIYNFNKQINIELENDTITAKNTPKKETMLANKLKNVITNTKVTETSKNQEINIGNYHNGVSNKSYTTSINENPPNSEKDGVNSTEIPLNIEEIDKDAEVIPFKVIEEMNRVKMYLNRNNRRVSVDGFSADSGFVSDSQIKCSLQITFPSSQNWLNQSAHCLLDYLLKCPLLTTNVDFTEEISMVLCDLIDQLHVEENYPQFLDLILEKIELFLEEISNGYDDQLESKTEQTIHRFLLLIKSIHIIKYTLEKLTKLLEKIHENLTKTDPYYEITNVNETQHMTYIFHILEIITKRYFKQKHGGSQNTQPSESLTKKTCISDIWRAKWSSKFKPLKELPSNEFEKEDVTERMAVILNKIIINCMEGYSLVSFAALQCFNVLQS